MLSTTVPAFVLLGINKVHHLSRSLHRSRVLGMKIQKYCAQRHTSRTLVTVINNVRQKVRVVQYYEYFSVNFPGSGFENRNLDSGKHQNICISVMRPYGQCVFSQKIKMDEPSTKSWYIPMYVHMYLLHEFCTKSQRGFNLEVLFHPNFILKFHSKL